MQTQQRSGLERAIIGFSNTVGSVAAIFIMPLLARYCRQDIQVFLRIGLDADIALWASWAVVLLVAWSAYFGCSGMLQTLLLSLFRRRGRANHGSPF